MEEVTIWECSNNCTYEDIEDLKEAIKEIFKGEIN